MDVMGWATTGMAARYPHVTDPVRADIAKRVGGLIWESDDAQGRAGGAAGGPEQVRTETE